MLIARFMASKISEGSVNPPFSKRVFAFVKQQSARYDIREFVGSLCQAPVDLAGRLAQESCNLVLSAVSFVMLPWLADLLRCRTDGKL
jgi:hypothetical protein